MQSVDYIDVFSEVCDLAGLQAGDVQREDAATIQRYISKRLKRAWRYAWWPDLTLCERRTMRNVYAAITAYVATNEVYFPQTKQYYQALKSTTGNAPADSLGNVDVAHWAVSQSGYSGNDYNSGTAYVAGNQVYYPTTDAFYQCHTAGTGNAPTDTAHWGILTPFDAYVGYAQSWEPNAVADFKAAYQENPRIFLGARKMITRTSQNGLQIYTPGASVFWVEFRQAPPRLSGAVFDAGSTYAVGQQVYFSDANTPGNFYECVTITSAGESPSSAAAKWDLVEIPPWFEDYLIQGAYSDYIKGDGQNEKAGSEDPLAAMLLGEELMRIKGQSGQEARTEVVTR